MNPNSKSTDQDLLTRYSAQKDETAFAELVSRYINLVYSAALRQTLEIQFSPGKTSLRAASGCTRFLTHP